MISVSKEVVCVNLVSALAMETADNRRQLLSGKKCRRDFLL